jgi:splicing factor 3B subunit 2
VLQEKKLDRFGKEIMGSTHTYDIPATGAAYLKKGQNVDIALDPTELELDAQAMSAKLEEQIKQQTTNLAKEDFSDMVAEHAARQKRKHKDATTAKSSKKYKDFKF